MDAFKNVLNTFLEIIKTLKGFFANLETELGIDFGEIFKKDAE